MRTLMLHTTPPRIAALIARLRLIVGNDEIARTDIAGGIAHAKDDYMRAEVQHVGFEAERLILRVEQAIRREDVDPALTVDGKGRLRQAYVWIARSGLDCRHAVLDADEFH